MDDDDIPVTLDMSDLATGPLSQFGWCDPCKQKDEEIARLKQEHATDELNFKALKKKIIATDQLLRQYRAKSLDCEMQNKQIEEWLRKYEKSQREVTVLEAQLMTALKEMEPVKKAKSELEVQLQKKDSDIEQLQIKLDSAELLNTQYEMRLATIETTHRDNDDAAADRKRKVNILEQSKKKLQGKLQLLKEENKQTKLEATKNKRAMLRTERRLKKTEVQLSKYLQILADNGLIEARKARRVMARVARLDVEGESDNQSDDSSDLAADLITDSGEVTGVNDHHQAVVNAQADRGERANHGTVDSGVPSTSKPAVLRKVQNHTTDAGSSATDLMSEIDRMFGLILPLHSPLPFSPAPANMSCDEESDTGVLSDNAPSPSAVLDEGADNLPCSTVAEEASPEVETPPSVVENHSGVDRTADRCREAVEHVSLCDEGDTSKSVESRPVETSRGKDSDDELDKPHLASPKSHYIHNAQNTENTHPCPSSRQDIGSQEEEAVAAEARMKRTHQVSGKPESSVSDTQPTTDKQVSGVTRSQSEILSKDGADEFREKSDFTDMLTTSSSSGERESESRLADVHGPDVTQNTSQESSVVRVRSNSGDNKAANMEANDDNCAGCAKSSRGDALSEIHPPRRVTRQMSARLVTSSFDEAKTPNPKSDSICDIPETEENKEKSVELPSQNHTPRRITRQSSKTFAAVAETQPLSSPNKKDKYVAGVLPKSVPGDASLTENSSENVFDVEKSKSPMKLTDRKQNAAKIFGSDSESEDEKLGETNFDGNCDDFLYSSPVPKLSSSRPVSRSRSRNFSEKENERPSVTAPSPAKRSISFTLHGSNMPQACMETEAKPGIVPDEKTIFGDVRDMDIEDEVDGNKKSRSESKENVPRRITRRMSARLNSCEAEMGISGKKCETEIASETSPAKPTTQVVSAQPQRVGKRNSLSLSSLSSSDSDDLSSDSSLSPMEEKPKKPASVNRRVTRRSKTLTPSASELDKNSASQTKPRPKKLSSRGGRKSHMANVTQSRMQNGYLQEEPSRESPPVGSPPHKKKPPLIKDTDEEVSEGESNSPGEARNSPDHTDSSVEPPCVSTAKRFSWASEGFTVEELPGEVADAADKTVSTEGSSSFTSQGSCSPKQEIPCTAPSFAADLLADKSAVRDYSSSDSIGNSYSSQKQEMTCSVSSRTEAADAQKHVSLSEVLDSGLSYATSKGDAKHTPQNVRTEGKLDFTESALNAAVVSDESRTKSAVDNPGSRSLKPCGELCVSEIEDDCKREDSKVVPNILRPLARFPVAPECADELTYPVSKVGITYPVNGAGDFSPSVIVSACEMNAVKSGITLPNTEHYMNEKDPGKEKDCFRDKVDFTVNLLTKPSGAVLSEGVSETPRKVNGLEAKGTLVNGFGDHAQASAMTRRRTLRSFSSSPTAFVMSKATSARKASCDLLERTQNGRKLAEMSDSQTACTSEDLPVGSSHSADIADCSEKLFLSGGRDIIQQAASVSADVGSAVARVECDKECEKRLAESHTGRETSPERPPSGASDTTTVLCSSISPSSVRPASTDSSATIIMCRSPSGWRAMSPAAHSDTGAMQMSSSEDVAMETAIVRPSSAPGRPLGRGEGCGGGTSDGTPGSDRTSAEAKNTTVGDSARAQGTEESSLSMIFDMFLELPDPVLPLSPSPVLQDGITSPASSLLSCVSQSDKPGTTSAQSRLGRDESPTSSTYDEASTVIDPKSLFMDYKQGFDHLGPVKGRRVKKQKRRKLKQNITSAVPASAVAHSNAGSTAVGPRVGVKVSASMRDANWQLSEALTPVEAAKRQLALRQQAAAKDDPSKALPHKPTSQAKASPAPPLLPAKRKSLEHVHPSAPKKQLVSPTASTTRKRVNAANPSDVSTDKTVFDFESAAVASKGLEKKADEFETDATVQEKCLSSVSSGSSVRRDGEDVASCPTLESHEKEAVANSLVSESQSTADGRSVPASAVTQNKQDLIGSPASPVVDMETSSQQAGDNNKPVAMVTDRGVKEVKLTVAALPDTAKNDLSLAVVQEKRTSADKRCSKAAKKKSSYTLEEKVEELVVEFCAAKTMPVETFLVQLQQIESLAKCWLAVIHAVIKLLRATEGDLQPVIVEACGNARRSAAARKQLSRQTFMTATEVHLLHLLLRLIESGQGCDRQQLMECLWAAIFSREVSTVKGQSAMCRMFVGLCGAEGGMEEVRVLAYNIVRCGYLCSIPLILAVAATWPRAFSRNSRSVDVGVLTVLEHLIMTETSTNPAMAKLGLCFERLCNWVPSVQEPQHILARLVAELQLTFRAACSESRKFELSRSIELLCSAQGVQWVLDHFLDKPVRSAAMKWIAKGPECDLEPEYLVTLLSLLGAVLAPFVQTFREKTHWMGLEQFIDWQCRPLLTGQYSHPDIEQSCAELLLTLSLVKTSWVFSILHNWCETRSSSVPKQFRDRVISLGNTIKARGLYVCLEEFR